jgi:hypothetical protein
MIPCIDRIRNETNRTLQRTSIILVHFILSFTVATSASSHLHIHHRKKNRQSRWLSILFTGHVNNLLLTLWIPFLVMP